MSIESKSTITLFADGRIRIRPLPYGKSLVVYVGRMYVDELKRRVLADVKTCKLGLESFTADAELSRKVRREKLVWALRKRGADIEVHANAGNGESGAVRELLTGKAPRTIDWEEVEDE